ncbi:hypothetical protein HMN09_00954700 [Mycena chlorophos]|uniref:PH domain-containing protein n=1 Tax=Mycena chlorophos TaxID=658473 RepID=A0A8H6SKW5_MYCCL|nr:hypothetical protein HMN09_00954700 [Mycena chlorophos]
MNHNRRASLLGQASDALTGFRFGRRRPPSVRLPPPEPPVFAIPHVIDITAPPPDEELEERERLRAAAAESIGLRPLIEDPPEQDEEDQEQPEHVVEQPTVDLPPFPASYMAVAPLAALSAALPKYYPPNSLRIFALSKQWKPRHIILSLPAGRVSHLHLFKGTHSDDRELERLEINADSVAFVSESDTELLHVVKVAGADVGARRRDWNAIDDASRTVWLLHLPSSADAQQWISRIKTAIFEQRTQRAGLPPTPATTGPAGDMDVMLSMRMAASPPSAAAPGSSSSSTSPSSPDAPRQPPTPTSPTYAASIAPSASERSVRSVATAPTAGQRSRARPPSSSGVGKGVAALKGLFSSHSRPRSSSSASVISASSSSFDGTSSTPTATPTSGGDSSFAQMGSILARTVSPNGNAKRTSSVLERRIIGHGERERVASESDAMSVPRLPKTSLEERRKIVSYAGGHGYALQPPPRSRMMKPWAEADVNMDHVPLGEEEEEEEENRPPIRMYTHPHGNASTGTAGSFGVRHEMNGNGHAAPAADRMSILSVSTSRSRASSVGNGSGSATRRDSGRGRRWSTLPKRMTPPEGAGTIPHPYAAASSSHERTSSDFGSSHSGGKLNPGSGWAQRGKRASGISMQSSVSGASLGQSSANASVGSLVSGHGRVRTSMPPPPRPAPTTALPPAPSSPPRTSRDSRGSSVSFREPVASAMASTVSLPQAKSSFRESTQRALRLSLIAPRQPPPSTTLPPRPDEHAQATPEPGPAEPAPTRRPSILHRRHNSHSETTTSPNGSLRNSLLGKTANKTTTDLHVIPAAPPPHGPLPPTPVLGNATPLARHASLKLKQRLRILSAPPAPRTEVIPEPSTPGISISEALAAPIARHPNGNGAMTLASFLSISASTPSTPLTATTPLPGTPIGEKILHDSSFLQMSSQSTASTPILRPMPIPAALAMAADSELYDDAPVAMASLLPPAPTRLPPDFDPGSGAKNADSRGGRGSPAARSRGRRHGSVISLLGIVTANANNAATL